MNFVPVFHLQAWATIITRMPVMAAVILFYQVQSSGAISNRRSRLQGMQMINAQWYPPSLEDTNAGSTRCQS
jgi:hypothetical protein